MPYELVWEPRCLVQRYRGHVTGAELIGSLREVSGDPRFDDLRTCIVDYLGVRSLTVGDDDAALIAALRIGSRYSNPRLVTLPVASDPAVKGELARLAALFQPGIEVHFHPTVDAARRWARTQSSLDAASA